MAVFVAASDETSGADRRSRFLYGGFLAPETDWTAFSEHWEKTVLAGPPHIQYLHMTEIRSPRWRRENGLTDEDAELRVDAAFDVIAATPSLTPISSSLNSGHMFDTYTKGVMMTSGSLRQFEPDYLAFVSYAYGILLFCRQERPDAEKVDFVIERNSKITDYIREFYDGMAIALANAGRNDLISLLGDLIPAGKERAPLQAADVLCWHARRSDERTLDEKGRKRFARLT